MSAITWHDIQQLSMNLPEFTQFVQLMNWQNNSCKFVQKIAQLISKRITCTSANLQKFLLHSWLPKWFKSFLMQMQDLVFRLGLWYNVDVLFTKCLWTQKDPSPNWNWGSSKSVKIRKFKKHKFYEPKVRYFIVITMQSQIIWFCAS